MSENVLLVQKAYACFGEGDIPGLLGLMTENAKWKTPDVEGTFLGESITGPQAIGEFFGQLVAFETMTHFEPTEFIDGGDKVVVLGNMKATVNATGRDYENEWVQIFTCENGKITAFLEYFDTAVVEKAATKAATA